MQKDMFECQAVTGIYYQLVPHCCSHCGGRLLRREASGGYEFRCAECGETKAGQVEAICCCGVITGDLRHPFRCELNTDRRPGFKNEVVVREVFD